jgi:hypothetical protein
MSLERIDTILRCLRIILELGGTTSHESFGRRLWPNATNWRRSPGRQLKASAGLLGRLCARGFLVRVGRGIYSITASGRLLVANGGYPSPAQPASPPSFAQTVPGAAAAYVTAHPQTYAAPQAPMYPPQPAPPVPAHGPPPPQPWPTMPPAPPLYPQPPPAAPSPQGPPMPWPWPPPWWPR